MSLIILGILFRYFSVTSPFYVFTSHYQMSQWSERRWTKRCSLIFHHLIVPLKQPNLLRYFCRGLKDVAATIIKIRIEAVYLNMAISIDISKMLAMSKKNVVRIGGIQWPGTHVWRIVPLVKRESGVPSSKWLSQAATI